MSRQPVGVSLATLLAVFHLATSATVPPSETTRLANGTSSAGRLEVWHDGEWGTVCDDNFEDVDAQVACYSLGFGYNGRAIGLTHGGGVGRLWLDEVNCTGSETFIGDCSHPGWGVSDCGHKEDVSIECFIVTTTAAPFQTTRLVGGSSSAGRLEVWYNETWGTVCDDNFGDVDASVACRSLGYGYDGRAAGNTYGEGTGPVWLDEVNCTGSETFVGDCAHAGWGVTDCGHKEDVSIECNTTPPPVFTRLAGGTPWSGRLEVLHNDEWGTVCSDNFDDVDASVACYSLGYGYSGRANGFAYGPGFGPIWLDEVNCTGTETFVGDCAHAGWGVTNCDHMKDISVECILNTN